MRKWRGGYFSAYDAIILCVPMERDVSALLLCAKESVCKSYLSVCVFMCEFERECMRFMYALGLNHSHC